VVPRSEWRDEELVRAAQGGDVAAFGQLYERYFDKVYSYLSFKLGNPTEAEDVAAQVFMKAMESLRGYKWTGVPFQAWLFRIAHNLLVDNLRRRSKRTSEPIDETLPDRRQEADPEATLAEKLTREGLLDAVERLTDLQKHVIQLKFAGGLSNAEVAAIMGKTEGAIKALQHAGLQALQRQLRRGAGAAALGTGVHA
jgi:RNA polymerase sigma-70 factor (ECF subfamily)